MNPTEAAWWGVLAILGAWYAVAVLIFAVEDARRWRGKP